MRGSASQLFRVKPHRCGIPRDVKAEQLQGMNTTALQVPTKVEPTV